MILSTRQESVNHGSMSNPTTTTDVSATGLAGVLIYLRAGIVAMAAVLLAWHAVGNIALLCRLDVPRLLTLSSMIDADFGDLVTHIPSDAVVDYVGESDPAFMFQCQYAIAPARIDRANYAQHRVTHPYVIEVIPPGSMHTSRMIHNTAYRLVQTYQNGLSLYRR